MTHNEILKYTHTWNTFTRIWWYNYTVRASGKDTGYYIFIDDGERISYISGQASYSAIYPAAAAAGVFNNIP